MLRRIQLKIIYRRSFREAAVQATLVETSSFQSALSIQARLYLRSENFIIISPKLVHFLNLLKTLLQGLFARPSTLFCDGSEDGVLIHHGLCRCNLHRIAACIFLSIDSTERGLYSLYTAYTIKSR